MLLLHAIALLITGLGVGFASGLLGVGGCFIMIPVQYYVIVAEGFSTKVAILTAFGTNLAVVLPTAMSGSYRHSRKGAVLWRQGIAMGITGAITSWIGAYVAQMLPGQILKVGFGLAILAGAIRMLTAKPVKIEEKPPENILPYVLWAIPLGFACGLIGIGGGVLMVPVMVLALKFRMHQAVGTSTALMIFTATGGILAYIFYGLKAVTENNILLPPYSIGYVNLLQWLLLAATSVPMAQIGALTAHKLSGKWLKYIFIAVMVYMALKMIGVFAWLHLPI